MRGAFAWTASKRLAALLLQDADEIDHVIRPRDRMGDRIRVCADSPGSA